MMGMWFFTVNMHFPMVSLNAYDALSARVSPLFHDHKKVFDTIRAAAGCSSAHAKLCIITPNWARLYFRAEHALANVISIRRLA